MHIGCHYNMTRLSKVISLRDQHFNFAPSGPFSHQLGRRSPFPPHNLAAYALLKLRPRVKATTICSAQGPPNRLLSLVLSTPRRIDTYFSKYPIRKVMWSVISAGGGFYAGNVVTLSFGALAVNDLFAAVITLLFYEVVSKAFYTARKKTLFLWFANYFKIGVVVALLADAIKLGG